MVQKEESPLDNQEINQSILKENQPWIFIGSTDAEAEAPIVCPPDLKSQLIGKDPDAGKDWEQEEKGQHGDRCTVLYILQFWDITYRMVIHKNL